MKVFKFKYQEKMLDPSKKNGKEEKSNISLGNPGAGNASMTNLNVKNSKAAGKELNNAEKAMQKLEEEARILLFKSNTCKLSNF